MGEGTGFNAYAGARFHSARTSRRARRSPSPGEKMFLADSQWHWSMEGRDLVREGNLGEYQENPAFAKEVGLEAESPRAVLDPNLAAMTPADEATQIPRGNSLYIDPEASTAAPVGDEHRPEHVHRLQRLRRRVPGREQHPDRRQGAGPQGPHHALDPARPVLLRRQGRPGRLRRRGQQRDPRGARRSRCSRSRACSASWPRARPSAR